MSTSLGEVDKEGMSPQQILVVAIVVALAITLGFYLLVGIKAAVIVGIILALLIGSVSGLLYHWYGSFVEAFFGRR